jgi:hypothetical protein
MSSFDEYGTPDYRDSTNLSHEVGGGGGASDDDGVEIDMSEFMRPVSTTNTSNDSDNSGNENKKSEQIRPVKGSAVQSGDKKKPVGKSHQQTKVARVTSDTTQLRNFPKSLANQAKAMFPSATNQSDAIAAYMYVMSHGEFDVSDDVKVIAKSYGGDRTVENLEKRVSSMEKQLVEMSKILNEIEILTGFTLYHRMGYSRANDTDTRHIDFLETGMEELLARIKEQTREKMKHDAIANGRPIR